MTTAITADNKKRAAQGDRPRFASGPRRGYFRLKASSSEPEDSVKQATQKSFSWGGPVKFERLIGNLLTNIGFQDIEITKCSYDGGINVRGMFSVGGLTLISTAKNRATTEPAGASGSVPGVASRSDLIAVSAESACATSTPSGAATASTSGRRSSADRPTSPTSVARLVAAMGSRTRTLPCGATTEGTATATAETEPRGAAEVALRGGGIGPPRHVCCPEGRSVRWWCRCGWFGSSLRRSWTPFACL